MPRSRSRSPRAEHRRPERSRSPLSKRRSEETRHGHRGRDPAKDGKAKLPPRHSNRQHHHHHHHSSHRSRHDGSRERSKDGKKARDAPEGGAELPCGARRLARGDLDAFEPLFAHYLGLQKSIDINELDETEVRGRWKSFVGKWNRGELAPGWYEPEIFARVTAERKAEELEARPPPPVRAETRPESEQRESPSVGGAVDEDGGDDDDDDYGPSLPGQGGRSSTRQGPGVPSLQELSLKRELDEEEREAQFTDLRTARAADRRQQKEQLDELVPRAEPGTRERKLEKRQAVNEKMQAFRDPSPGGDEVADADLVGGGEGGMADYKRMLASEKQKLTERQQRREEVQRARNAERDERIRVYREREEGTMEKLRELARRRFG
ncbi:hypothetical protein B0H67DRAFT_309601 [Lasiosphaeris hirsuta]|uniref:Uncharacterized protein n=1 Tax=Lasiosphaeris hirsuta TaxID=260670 RepID=A0AA40A1B4_9PEZI|nr:hypothetical protein B0H67DRAFT_309601 [Lasiosphaeris hirsuta]